MAENKSPDTNKIFISYARRDGRELALRLREDLTTVGYEVWLDTHEIRGGESWTNRIESAIDTCHVGLVLLSDGSFRSKNCRGEHSRLLEKRKHIITIKVQETADCPVNLATLHHLDFSNPTKYAENFAELQRAIVLDDYQPTSARFRSYSNHHRRISFVLPENYVERTDLLAELRKALIETTVGLVLTSEIKSRSPNNPIALHGMGGIGKTVMARALCDDTQVQAAFPDGILWTTCGQTPNLIQELRGWITALGHTYDDKAELVDLQAQLTKLLANRVCLLVVDDVWQKKHLQTFRVGGTNCRTIITTRDEVIAEELGAKIKHIPLMSESDAVSLLELWAQGKLASTSWDKKAEIVNRVGRLALAIRLAGGQLIRQTPEAWLKGFDVHKLKSRRPDSDNPHDSLEACFELSLQQLEVENRRLYAALSIFPEDEPILEKPVEMLWQVFGNCDLSMTSILLDDLSARALLEITQRESPMQFIIHDLLRDFMAAELKLKGSASVAHEALIAAYAKTCTGEGWHTAPHDGYLYTHLAYHLHAAGRNEELYRLLTDSPEWMEAKYIACVGDRAYVDDLELAISDFHDPLTADQVLTLAKLWTARQVVNTRVSLYEDIDLETLVWMGRRQEAETHARLRTDPKRKADGLLAIYRAQQENGLADINLLLHSRIFALVIADIDIRGSTLHQISRAFVRASRLDEALSTANIIEDFNSRTDALNEVAIAFAKVNRLDEALTIARVIENDKIRSGALCAIAVTLAQTGQPAQVIFDEAITSAFAIKKITARITALVSIGIASVNINVHTQITFENALDIARTIDSTEVRADALLNIAKALAQTDQPSVAIFDEAFATASAINSESIRNNVLRGIYNARKKAGLPTDDIVLESLTHRLPDFVQAGFLDDDPMPTIKQLVNSGKLEEALQQANDIEYPYSKAAGLRIVANALAVKADSRARSVFDNALKEARLFEEPYSHDTPSAQFPFAVCQMGVAVLPDIKVASALFTKALEFTRTLGVPEFKAWDLLDIAKKFSLIDQPNNAILDEAADAGRDLSYVDDEAQNFFSELDAVRNSETLDSINITRSPTQPTFLTLELFETLDSTNLNKFLETLANKCINLEKDLRLKLNIPILREAVRIAAWYDQTWNDVHTILAAATQDR